MQKDGAVLELEEIVDLSLAGLVEADDRRSCNLINRAMACIAKLADASKDETSVDRAAFNVIWREVTACIKTQIMESTDRAMPDLAQAKSVGKFELAWRDCLGSSSPVKVS